MNINPSAARDLAQALIEAANTAEKHNATMAVVPVNQRTFVAIVDKKSDWDDYDEDSIIVHM